ncbi:MAG: hypothetical protein QXK24_00220 [Ignisphaera sp.]
MSIVSKIKDILKDKLGPGSTAYGILKPCRRCAYQKSHESILIFSKERGPRIIIVPGGKCFLRQGDCLGLSKCSNCFEQVNNPTDVLPCRWKEF